MSQFNFSQKKDTIWISASAGTGKTWSLTNRVMSLLLQNVAPEKILCITFTNNAAFEMSERISSAVCELLCLEEKEFICKAQTDYHLDLTADYESAISVLLNLLDKPGSLRIHTIHSFCLDLVKSHPFELGLRPGFGIMSELALKQAVRQAFEQVILNLDEENNPLLEVISTRFKETRLQEELERAICQGGKLKRGFKVGELTSNLHHLKGQVRALQNQFIDIVTEFCDELLKTDISQNMAVVRKLLEWHMQDREQKQDNFTVLREIFLTKDGELRKSLLTKQLKEDYESLGEKITEHQQLVFKLCKKTEQLEDDFYSEAMLIFLGKALKAYSSLKNQMNLVDFDDIIKLADELLSKNEFSNWVLYKLDYKFDHVLVDEAQDTNHQQWKIIQKICEEFYSSNQLRWERSLFVVGDNKQSIFGFQGSDPDCFDHYANYYQNKIAGNLNTNFQTVRLKKSFRSSRAVIDLVNHLFAPYFTEADQGEELHEIHHDAKGLVELWPLFTGDGEQEAEKKLASSIAHTISEWLAKGRCIASTGKVVKAKDIMILVKTRGVLYKEIIKALNEYNIPNSGEDRFEINEHLFFKDLIACAQFALFPEDDLICATLLRSPFIEIDDQLLENLCVGRTRPLYQLIENDVLSLLLANKHQSPKDFFYSLIFTYQHKYLPYYGATLKNLINQFSGLIDEFEKSNVISMELFVDWVLKNKFEIKKDQDFKLDEVKIITTHSSKGLEAEIVFFPDTTGAENDKSKLIEVEEEIYYSLNSTTEGSLLAIQRLENNKKQKEESIRLLYVGLTRAAKELYIMGATNRATIKEDCWYSIIEGSFKEIAQYDQGKYRLGENDYRYYSKAEKKELPSNPFLSLQNKNIPTKILNIMPSREVNFESISPFDERYLSLERGSQVHGLMSVYPGDKKSKDQSLAFLKALYPLAASSLDFEKIDEFYAKLAGQKIYYEVNFIDLETSGISGVGRLYKGSIDMLTLEDGNVTIYEFKSNKDVPLDRAFLPEIYKNQMQNYCNITQKHFLSYQVKAQFFWLYNGLVSDFAINSS